MSTTDNTTMTNNSTLTDNLTLTDNSTTNNSETSTIMTTNKPMLASLGEYLEMDYALTQLKCLQVNYKIDCETNTLKINYQSFEDGIIKMYQVIINKFMKKYPNYSNLWSN